MLDSGGISIEGLKGIDPKVWQGSKVEMTVKERILSFDLCDAVQEGRIPFRSWLRVVLLAMYVNVNKAPTSFKHATTSS